MKNIRLLISCFAVALLFVSCEAEESGPVHEDGSVEADLSLGNVARILSSLPMQNAHLNEVFDAVNSSSGHGYDEEYMMADLFVNPGAGVGSGGVPSRAGGYDNPLRDLFEDYFNSLPATRSSSVGAKEYIEALSASDIQIYWPYSSDWDGEEYPIVTFDPGYGAESNYGYEVRIEDGGVRVVDSVYVDESVAMRRPVWVINRNDDSAFTPQEMFVRSGTRADAGSAGTKLMIKEFTMLRNYDSWFGGASEFFVKCGAVDGFKASKDEDLKLYHPSVTDFMISVKRRDVKVPQPFECLLLTDFTDQIDKLAFLITEDDGGTTTTWKCQASVKYKSKNYGFDIEIPYKDKDDIVWRGQLSGSFFMSEKKEVTGRFGDVMITFSLE